jgi:hypothetical protein
LPPPVPALLVVGYAAALGVLIDLDHFLLARLNTGRWRAARAVVRKPRLVLVDQESIFETGEVGAVQRLWSHLLVTVALVGGLLFVSPYLAVLSGVVLAGHVLSDVVWDFTSVLGPARAHQRGA